MLWLAVAVLQGCAWVEESRVIGEEEELTKAGFQLTTQIGEATEARPYQLEERQQKNTVQYWYIDTRREVAYVGGSGERQRYEALKVEKKAKRAAALANLSPWVRRTPGGVIP